MAYKQNWHDHGTDARTNISAVIDTNPENFAKQMGWKVIFYRRATGVSGFKSYHHTRMFCNFLADNGYEILDLRDGEVFYHRASFKASEQRS